MHNLFLILYLVWLCLVCSSSVFNFCFFFFLFSTSVFLLNLNKQTIKKDKRISSYLLVQNNIVCKSTNKTDIQSILYRIQYFIRLCIIIHIYILFHFCFLHKWFAAFFFVVYDFEFIVWVNIMLFIFFVYGNKSP
jgi:hypothetical protein